MPVCIWLPKQMDGKPLHEVHMYEELSCITKVFHMCKKFHMHDQSISHV